MSLLGKTLYSKLVSRAVPKLAPLGNHATVYDAGACFCFIHGHQLLCNRLNHTTTAASQRLLEGLLEGLMERPVLPVYGIHRPVPVPIHDVPVHNVPYRLLLALHMQRVLVRYQYPANVLALSLALLLPLNMSLHPPISTLHLILKLGCCLPPQPPLHVSTLRLGHTAHPHQPSVLPCFLRSCCSPSTPYVDCICRICASWSLVPT